MRLACQLQTLLLLCTAMACDTSVAAASLQPMPTADGREATVPKGHLRQDHYDRFVVGFAKGAKGPDGRRRALDRAAVAQGLRVADLHETVGGMRVIRTSRSLDVRESSKFVDRLQREDGVVYAARDGRMRILSTPNDPMYGQQWNLGPTAWGTGIRANLAWDRATGQGVVVGVVDTGITAHPDLAGKVVPGRDFITDLPTANDGNGRDADPTDPGDWNTADQCDPAQAARDSSWHGTHMAGIVAAATNNGLGVAGTAPGAMVMPLRALGPCGGFTSDIADAILWAAGGAVAGLPLNPNPVDVINLSIGAYEPCIAPLQMAIDHAVSQGIVVVVAAGNDGKDARDFANANCLGVIAVGATNGYGYRAWYSNSGSLLDLSAPGGAGGNTILSTHNTGKTTVGTPSYAGYSGTSQATAHVSGVVALMQSAAPTAPADVEAIIAGTARPFAAPYLESAFGSGVADAKAAVDAVLDGALMISDAQIVEGSSGTTLVSVEVRLSRPMPGPVSFDLATGPGPYVDDAASAPGDYLPLSLVGETFPPGTTSRRYTVQVVGDATPERDELFQLVLSNVQGVAVARGAALVHVVNDDPVPLVSGVMTGPFTSRVFGMRQLFSIDVPANTASLNVDVSHAEGGLLGMSILPGVLPEPDQGDCTGWDGWGEYHCSYPTPQPGRWYVLMYGGDYYEAKLTATYQSAAPPLMTLHDAVVTEGNAGTTLLSFPVTLSAPAPSDVQFDVAIGDGTAFAGQDFTLPASQLRTIPAGQSSAQVDVAVHGDASVEGNETLAATVVSVQGATLARGQAQGRIANDDLASLSIGDIAVTETDGASTATVTVSLSTPMPSPVAFDVRTVAGSAHAGSDYTARSLTGRYLDAGRTRQLFEVVLVGDNVAEASESFTVVVENLTGALPGDLSATISVADDDAPTVAAKRSATTARPRAARLDGKRTR